MLYHVRKGVNVHVFEVVTVHYEHWIRFDNIANFRYRIRYLQPKRISRNINARSRYVYQFYSTRYCAHDGQQLRRKLCTLRLLMRRVMSHVYDRSFKTSY